MTADFDRAVCDAIRGRLDVYLDGEAPADVQTTIETHLGVCTACADEVERRRTFSARLRAAARNETAPPDLAVRVRSRLDAETHSRAPRPLWMVAAAAAVVLAVGWGASLRFTGAPPHVFLAAELEALRLAHEVGDLLGLGLGDHVHCAAYRRFADANLTFERAAAQMAAADADAARALEAAVADDPLDLRLAHRCDFRGREFLHFALTDDAGGLVSVMFTERASGDSISGAAAEAEAGGYDVSGFAHGSSWAFVASDRGMDANRRLVARLRKNLVAADFLPRRPAEIGPSARLRLQYPEVSFRDANRLQRNRKGSQHLHARPSAAEYG